MTDNDAIILAAFERWTASNRFMDANTDKELDKQYWAAMEQAELVICSTPASTVKAAEAALWLALDYADAPIDDQVRNQNLDALLTDDSLDWNVKLIVRGIANLRSIAGEA